MADRDPADDLIECRTYTHARRFPLVIGQIGGYYLPVPWTPAQLLVWLGTLLSMLWTRRLWGVFGSIGNLVVLVLVPFALSWLVRHLKIEGRTTFRALGGFARYLARSPQGRLHGRAIRRTTRPHRRSAPRIFVTQSASVPVPALQARVADRHGHANGGVVEV